MKTRFIPLVFTAFLLFGCNEFGLRGSGVIKSEDRQTGRFDKIDVSGVYNVDVTCGEEYSIKVICDDNLVPFVRTDIKNGVLSVWNEEDLSSREGITIKVEVPKVSKISSSGVCNINVKELDNPGLKVSASGVGKINISGKTNDLQIDLSGAVKINTKNLYADYVNVNISGASSAEVHVSKELGADISGMGKIEYSGNPEIVHKNISGFGSIYTVGE